MTETITWYIGEDGFPTNTKFIDVPEKAIEKPYPKAVWRIDSIFNNALPYHELLPIEKPSGAFMNAVNLEYAHIPRSCKKIGEWAFTNTKLRRVTIAADCEYYQTTFPKGCQIDFYNNQGGT